jgi:hypothetical protein
MEDEQDGADTFSLGPARPREVGCDAHTPAMRYASDVGER